MAAEKTSWLKTLVSRYFGADKVDEVDHAGFYNAQAVSMTSLLGAGKKTAQARESIYQTYQAMQYDPIVSGALRINVTAALGADQETGRMVHIEANPKFAKDKSMERYAKEVSEELTEILNDHVAQLAYNGVAYGDAYARIYTRPGKGVTSLCSDEMMLPPLIQPYEQGDRTVVCVASVGPKLREKLSMAQITRLKMPRFLYIPQPTAIEKAMRMKVAENDFDSLPIMPSLVGGSFLAEAEEQYYRYTSTLNGLVNQRILDSIDETILTARMHGMTVDQQAAMAKNIGSIFARSKQVFEEALKSGQIHAGRIRHLLPTWGEKGEITEIRSTSGTGGSGQGRSANVSIEDALLHAKLLAGSMGVDISMLGFADILSGGLGEGGYLRTSVQSAERARMLRVSTLKCLNHVADVHMAFKHRVRFKSGERPWQMKFYGSIATVEAENQRTQTDATNNALMVSQLLGQLKDSGMDAAAMQLVLERVAKMTTEDAKAYALAIEAARAAEPEPVTNGSFGGE